VTAPSPSTEAYEHADKARLAAFRRVYENYLVVEDIYPGLAHRFEEAGVRSFAELGGGRGPISTLLGPRGIRATVVDLDPEMLAGANGPAVRADIAALPFADTSVDGAAAVNCLYFLAEPIAALREARRVLRPGGLFVASAPSRWNDPELAGLDPRWGIASSFDAEDAAAVVAEVFGEVEVHPWRVVAYHLPDHAAIADYLHAFNVPDWQNKAAGVAPPLQITKVGAEVWARA
jgi:SAM-dependent methyltransferase